MFKPHTIFILLFNFLMFPLTGQDMFRIDSLITQLSIQEHDSVRSRIMFQIASEIMITDTVMAQEYLTNARSIAESQNDTRGLGLHSQILGKMHRYHGNYELAILEFDRALAYFTEADDQVLYFETVKEKGNVYLGLSDYTQALSLYNSALEFYKRNEMTLGISRCLNNMGIIHKNRGEYVEALSVYEESILYLDTMRNAYDISQAYINMGNVFVLLGSYQVALEYYEKALEISERENFQKNISLCLSNSGVIQNKYYNYTEAMKLYRRSLQVSESLNDRVQVSNCLINIGTNYADMGQPETGLEYVQEGMAIKMELGDERTISNCYIHLAEIHTMMEQYDRAIELFNTAIPVKEELGDQEGLVRSYLGLGAVYLEWKQLAQAGRMTDQALEIALRINAKEHIVHGYEIKRDIAVSLGNYQSAYQFAMQYNQYNDSLMNEATARAVMEMEFRNRAKALEQENENLRMQSDLTTALMRKRNAVMYSVLGLTLVLAAGLGLVAYFLRRLRHSSLKLEEQNLIITKQNLKLDNLNKTKDRMMSIIAHDLRGTIGNQLTAIEVLHRVEGDEHTDFDKRKLFGNLKNSASYSLELLENLLHWSRLEGDESYYHPEDVKLENLISNCITLFDETARNKNLTFQLDVEESLTARVDRIMTETIFRNLISNAIKFSNPGGDITIQAVKKDHKVYFRVVDQGIGMTEDQLEKLYSNGGFTRRGTANEKGAGIGLTLVREFTAMHQGELNIDSTPDKGSRFEVVFPCIN